MSGWTYIWIGGLLLMVGTILTTLGWNQLKKREEAFSLSVPPSLEITVQPGKNVDIQDITFRNTGQHELLNLEIYAVRYKIQRHPQQVLSRGVGSGPDETIQKLDLDVSISLPSDKFTGFIADEEMTETSPIEAIALVVAYRRKGDNKRFINIEPFGVAKIGDGKALFALYSGKLAASTGPPSLMVNILKEIIETEKLLFRADN